MKEREDRARGLDRERLMLELRRAAKPFVVFCVFLVGVLFAASVILANVGVTMPWANSYKTKIAVDDAAGVVAKKQGVRIAGIEVGTVDDFDLVKGQAILTLKMDPEDGPLYKDARVRIRPETALDDLYVDVVDRGTPAAGKLGEDDVLDVQRTRTAVDVGKVLNVFNADVRERTKMAIDGYGRALGDQGDEFRQSLAELAPFLDAAGRLTHEFAIRQDQTSRLIHNFRLMTEELALRDVDLRKIVAGGSGALGELAGSEQAVQQTLVELAPTMTQLQSTFQTVRGAADTLDPAFDALRPVADSLPAGLRGLRDFSTKGLPSFKALRRPLPSLQRLVGRLRPTARSLRQTFLALRPVPARLNRTTSLIPNCERPLAKFFQNTNSVGKFQDDKSVIIRGEAVVGFNSSGVANDPNQAQAPSCAPGGGVTSR